MMTAAIFAVLLFFIMVGLPIAISMGLTAVIFFVVLGHSDLLLMVPARMYSSTTGFPLLAIPFFILVGLIMNTGGMTQRIFRLAQCMVGHIKGGLGHVNVVNSMIFSGISGSAIADAAGIGMVELEAMVNAGFDRRFSAAVTAASSTIGPIIPPSIPFVIFGSMTGTSVGRLFLGGFIPGILMGVFMMVVVYIVSSRRGYPREKRATLGELFRAILDSWSATLCPVVIIGGIMVGIFTPTEAAIVSVAYALVVTLRYREIAWKDLPKILWETLQHTIRVMFIISSAGIFGWLLVHQKVPEAIITGLTNLSSSPWVILLIINIILLVLGCFMEITSIMLLTIPIFMPLITKVGIDPVHFGNVMTLNLMIGLLAPPAGLVLCTVASVAKVPIWELAYECRWYMVAILATLALITYIPSLVTWVPDVLMGPGR